MRIREGGSAGPMIVVVAAMCLAASIVAADPSTDCRNLGLVFGARPATLDMQSLAALSTCVTDAIQTRAASPPATPSSDPQDGDQSSGGQTSAQDDGGWSTPPAWKDKSSESKPWDSYDK
jgi:hypothetical protein